MITEFKRYEFKYILRRAQAEALRAELSSHLPADPHSGDSGYWINSLYYDSEDLEFFWAKIDGLSFRRKLRLRSYESVNATEAPSHEPVAVEIKQRLGQIVEKRRVFLSRSHGFQLCSGQSVPIPSASGQGVANEVLHLVQEKALQPTCWVRYHRHALMGTVMHPDLRITFDTELSASTNALTAHHVPEERSYFLPPDRCILEVKVTHTMPLWVQVILQRHHCLLQGISKYCTSIAQHKSISVLELRLPHDLQHPFSATQAS
jgi:hypothetical protein